MIKLFRPRLRIHYEEYDSHKHEWIDRQRDYYFYFLAGWFIERCQHSTNRLFRRVERIR